MKIILNCLYQSSKFKNERYKCEINNILYFIAHHSIILDMCVKKFKKKFYNIIIGGVCKRIGLIGFEPNR
jgi:hypothetical protein